MHMITRNPLHTRNTMMNTPTALRKLVAEYSATARLEYRVWFGYQHGDEPRKQWYIQGFGANLSSALGRNAVEACEEICSWLL